VLLGRYRNPAKILLIEIHATRAPSVFLLAPPPPPPPPPPLSGGVGKNSSSRGCVGLGGEVDLPPGVVKEEVAVLVVLVCLHCRAVGAAVRRAVDDEVLGAFAFEEETGPTAVRRVPPGLLDALRVHALSTFGIAVVVVKSRFTA